LLDVGALVHALLLLGGVALLPGAHQLAGVDDLDDAARAADPDDLAGQGVAGEVVAAGERHRPGRVDQPVDHARVAGEVVQWGEAVGLVEGDFAGVVGAVEAAIGLAAQAGAGWLAGMAGAAPAPRGWSSWPRLVAAGSVVWLGLGVRAGVGGRGGPPGAGVGWRAGVGSVRARCSTDTGRPHSTASRPRSGAPRQSGGPHR